MARRRRQYKRKTAKKILRRKYKKFFKKTGVYKRKFKKTNIKKKVKYFKKMLSKTAELKSIPKYRSDPRVSTSRNITVSTLDLATAYF